MPRVKYVGPLDVAEAKLPDGTFVKAERNHHVEVTSEQAKHLTQKATGGDWEAVTPPDTGRSSGGKE